MSRYLRKHQGWKDVGGMELLELWKVAERVIREYGISAEEECAARAAYHQMQRDDAQAHKWRIIKELVERLRNGERAPVE
jgi:hypothetical protein